MKKVNEEDVKKITNTGVELVDRLFSPTPKFWKKVRTIGLILTSIGGVVIALPVSIGVPEIVNNITIIVLAVGGTLTGAAQATSTKH